jgi:hypothetical protein
MTTHVFTIPDHTESLNIFFRVWDTSGNVFDFSDNTFKAIGGATTPYVAATERTAMGGTGKSGYQASIDLALLNNTALAKRYILKAYTRAGGSPADTDAAISEALIIDGGLIVVQAGELGEAPVIVQVELSVKSTAGSTGQVSCWLERNGRLLPVSTLGGTVFTAATDDVVTSAGHGLSDTNVLILTTSNTLPAGLSTGTPYFVRDATTDTFKLALTSGGAAIDITSTGTGVHKWHKPTATVTVREHGSGSNLFSKAMDADDLVNSSTVTNIFEDEQTSPGFTDDRQFAVTATITENGNTWTTIHNRVVIG